MNHEPESFRLLPGAGGSPVILHVPHSSRAVPESVRGGIVLDDRELEQELDHITDSHTADIAAGGGPPPRAPPPRLGYSRERGRSRTPPPA
ncbi:N-formylglutamate amidohydrolase, partial [Streptomyces sp. NPDC059538]